MGKERSEADKRITERRAQAEELQRQVSPSPDIAASRCERVPLSSNHHSRRDITKLLFFVDG